MASESCRVCSKHKLSFSQVERRLWFTADLAVLNSHYGRRRTFLVLLPSSTALHVPTDLPVCKRFELDEL